ncbi:MAG: hypothetical protein ABH869_07705 [Candidatus Omnitrophota bacterium]
MKKTFLKNYDGLSGSGIKGKEKGVVLVIVMFFMSLMVLSAVSLSNMIQQDIRLVEHVRERTQAKFIAEAGINHALAKIQADGFDSRQNFNGALDIGSYTVTHSTFSVSGLARHRITSVGTISGVSETAIVEVKDSVPTALYCFSGAGNDINIKVHTHIENAVINGNMHANNNLSLTANKMHSKLTVTGDVSATGIVVEGTLHNQSDKQDNNVYINGFANDQAVVTEGSANITFPVFDYTAYKQAAQDDGLYYSTDKTFSGTPLSPDNGIVYVDGDVIITGEVTLYGGLIAETITIAPNSTLYQKKTADADNRNVIIAKNGDISIAGYLDAEEALIYASQDILSSAGGSLEPHVIVNGTMLAARDITMWNTKTHIIYNHVQMSPEDMEAGGFEVVSWNK